MGLELRTLALHIGRVVASPPTITAEALRRTGRLDGRQARSERTHRAVLDGLRECLRDGEIEPTARSVASKAGVSLRAVFRHFHHLETLYSEVFVLEYERVVGSERKIRTDISVDDRVRRLVAQRARRNERLAPVRGGGQRFEHSAELLEQYERVRRRERDEAAALFGEEIGRMSVSERRDALATISAALSWTVWGELRHHERLSAPVSRAVLERLVHSAL